MCKNQEFRVGDRVVLSGDRSGIIRWIGKLDSDYVTSEVFVGVQLDEPSVLILQSTLYRHVHAHICSPSNVFEFYEYFTLARSNCAHSLLLSSVTIPCINAFSHTMFSESAHSCFDAVGLLTSFQSEHTTESFAASATSSVLTSMESLSPRRNSYTSSLDVSSTIGLHMPNFCSQCIAVH